MNVTGKVNINSNKEKIWSTITDIKNAKDNISGINSVEIIHDPENTLVGLKWKESRTMFGKDAYETMWITEAVENEFYQTRAESHGAIYISKFNIIEKDDYCELTMSFQGSPQKLLGKLMGFIFGGLMSRSTLKMIQVDLEDIKMAVESKN